MSNTKKTLHQEKHSEELREKAAKAITDFVTAQQKGLVKRDPFLDAIFHFLKGSTEPESMEDLISDTRFVILDVLRFLRIPEVNKKWEEEVSSYIREYFFNILDRLFFLSDTLSQPDMVALLTKYSIENWQSQSDEELLRTIAIYRAKAEGCRLLNEAINRYRGVA